MPRISPPGNASPILDFKKYLAYKGMGGESESFHLDAIDDGMVDFFPSLRTLRPDWDEEKLRQEVVRRQMKREIWEEQKKKLILFSS